MSSEPMILRLQAPIMSNSSTPARSTGLSLYANLLDPTAAATPASVSRGPVVFKTGTADAPEEASAKKHRIDAATLRFQPTKRPQLSQKPKPKTSFPRPPLPDNPNQTNSFTPISSISGPARATTKSTLADWAATGDDDDVNGFYGTGEKRQRGGRKRRKKNKEDHAILQDWDDIYDPARPNSFEEYKHSDEKVREVREWKDRLYAHREARKVASDKGSDDEDDYRPQMSNQFAPPPNYSFAPPPMDSPPRKVVAGPVDVDFNLYSHNLNSNQVPPPPPENLPPPTIPPEPLTAGSISRAPVRYSLPDTLSEIPSSQAKLVEDLAAELEDEEHQAEGNAGEEPRSLRPGQKGFAERLMSKYGWSKGSGLGADGSGIVNALRVQVEKRKKKSDAEGGGFRDPGGRGKIIGGKKNAPEKDSDAGKFGPMSEVIVLRGMVDGMNLDEEVEGAGDGGLMQEIGDECSDKYGRVERVYIDRHGTAPAKVFVKFTSQLSALRAVNDLEGRVFNGNTISALFYDAETFERGIYEQGITAG